MFSYLDQRTRNALAWAFLGLLLIAIVLWTQSPAWADTTRYEGEANDGATGSDVSDGACSAGARRMAPSSGVGSVFVSASITVPAGSTGVVTVALLESVAEATVDILRDGATEVAGSLAIPGTSTAVCGSPYVWTSSTLSPGTYVFTVAKGSQRASVDYLELVTTPDATTTTEAPTTTAAPTTTTEAPTTTAAPTTTTTAATSTTASPPASQADVMELREVASLGLGLLVFFSAVRTVAGLRHA